MLVRKLSNISNTPIINETGAVMVVMFINKSVVSGLIIHPNPINIAPKIIFTVLFLVASEFFKNTYKNIKGMSEVPKKIKMRTKFGKLVNPRSNTIIRGITPVK